MHRKSSGRGVKPRGSTPHGPCRLNAQHQEHLTAFGIPLEMLKEAGVQSVTDATVRLHYGFGRNHQGQDLSGILIPYFNGDKPPRRIGARIRLDSPLPDSSKYISERGNQHLYVPLGGYSFFGDTSIPVIFVESEKAALAIVALANRTSRMFLPIALGGCWGWRRKTGKKTLANGSTEPETGPAPDLDLIILKDRTVLVAFDSNTASRAGVRAARNRLAKELRKRGAHVSFVDIPALEGVNGPDDLIKIAGDAALLTAIDEASPPPGRETQITVRQGEYPEALDQAEERLVKHAKRLKIFQRGGEVQRIVRLPEDSVSGGLSRRAGTLQLDALSEPVLMEILERLMWFRKIAPDGDTKRANCPPALAARYLRRKQWHLPVLIGFVCAPVMRPDGSILSTPGYDDASRLFLVSEQKWLPVPEKPTREDARAALDVLRRPFKEFPFREDADRAVLMAGILTAVQRRLLPACPLFAFSAPAPRSGKSLLAEALAIVATGKPAPASAVSTDREEFRKALFSALREGLSVINLDNVEHALRSAHLCEILTQDTYSDRLLGESTQKSFSTNVLFTATGNNLTIRGDLTTRTLLCFIDPKLERPEQRKFEIGDLKKHLMEHRPELVQAALTILRAYHIAQPGVKLSQWGGFEQWSDSIRKPLVWAGEADPCDTRESLINGDPDSETAFEALQQFSAKFNREEFTAPEAAAMANEKMNGAHEHHDLHRALVAVTSGKETVDAKEFGYWMRTWRGRIVGGFRLGRSGRSHGGAKWKVEKA